MYNTILKNKPKPTTITKKKRLGVGERIKLANQTRSGLETKALNILKKHCIDFEYEPKDKKLTYHTLPTNHTYLPDIILDDYIYEMKGYFSPENRQRMIDIKRCNPHVKICMVFMQNNPIRKGSRTRYLDWCVKHNIEAIMFEEFEDLILKRHK